MFANGKSILVQPLQRDVLIGNEIDCRLIDIQQKITDLLSAGYVIYDVASATNSNFNNLIALSSANRICVWKSAGSTAYTLLSTELASNGTNVIVNAQINNMNLVTNIRDCKLTCSASSGLFANKAEFYGGDWYLAAWSTGSNVKFSNCNVHADTAEVYMPDVNFDYCNVNFKKSGTLAYSTFKENKDTIFVNETTAGSTVSTLTLAYNYTTDTDWFTRCTIKDFQNTGTAVLSSTAQRTLNFNGLKIENTNLAVTNLYTTEGNKIYYEGQDLVLSGSLTAQAWSALGGNISSSSGLYPSIAIDSNGIQYVAFQDNANSDKASCYKYGSTGWSVVGYVGLSSNSMDYINIHLTTNNTPIIIGRDNSSKATAYYYSVSATSWNLLGSAGFTTNNVNILKSNCLNSYFTIAVSNTSIVPYVNVYYLDYVSSSANWSVLLPNYTYQSSTKTSIPIDIDIDQNHLVTVNSTGGIDTWYLSDATYFTEHGVSSTGIGITKIKENRIDVYNHLITIIDGTSKLTTYNMQFISIATPSSWALKGYSNYSTGTAQYISAEIINSVPYIAIQDTTTKPAVYKYVAANSSWNLVGSAQFSTDNVNRMQLVSFNGTPYLAVEETGVSQGISVYSFGEVVTNSNVNYSFENLETDIFDGEKVLDITSIQSSSNYIVQNCKVRPVFNIADTAVGRFIRNAYNIELAPGWNPTVSEVLKQTNADTFWVVSREDIEATLNGMIIKNLKLYTAGLVAYDYKSNDNFVIIANNASKGNAVFCFYNGKIKGTVFSDSYLDVSYTITDCFILMETQEISDLQNQVSSTSITDGPLENGSITFNSYDNEICI